MGPTPTIVDNSLGEYETIEITGKVMVVAIIIFIVIVFVLVHHLYAKCFWRNMGERTSRARPDHLWDTKIRTPKF